MRASRLEITGLTATVAIALALAWPALWSAVDDAFISARYADQWVAGHGWTWSAGSPPVEGFSNPLWTLWLAVGLALGAPIHGWMVGWGLAGWLAALPGAWLCAREASDGESQPLLAPWLLATAPVLAVAATNGLETGVWLGGLVWVSWGAMAARGRWEIPAGIGLAALAWTRPEGVIAGVVWIGWRAIEGRTVRTLAGLWAGGVALLFAWRLAVFGAWLPNPAHAKVGARGWAWILTQNTEYLWRDGWLWPVLLAAVVAAALWPPIHRGRVALVALALALIAPALTVELWMPGGRLLTPLYLLGAVAIASRVRDLRAAIAIAAISAAAAVPLWPRAHVQDTAHTVQPDNGAARAARWIRDHAPEGSLVATRDAGVFAFWLGPQLRTWETHPRPLTHLAGDRPGQPLPDILVLTQSREGATGSHYPTDEVLLRRLGPEYRYLGRVHQHWHRYYDLYARSDLGIPPLPEALVINRLGPLPAAR